MITPRVKTAVILAAGEGSRLREGGASLPKPLTVLGGLSLLERVIRNAAKAGIEEFVVVLGHRGREIREAVASRLHGVRVRWVENDCWRLGNGTSVLAARPFTAGEPVLVLMADHLVFAKTLGELLDAASRQGESVLAVDRKRGVVVDEADATKVRLESGWATAVGKSLEPFDGIDIGAAVLAPEFFDELQMRADQSEGSCGHGEGLAALAGSGRLAVYDIGADLWEDVDTEEARQSAETILFDSLRKRTDGLLSRWVERRLSLAVTRRLCNTNLTPNQVSASVVVIGAIGALLFAQPARGWQVIGALVFWCSSFLDGCDGELARLKFLESRLGGWLDLWVDNLVHCMVFFGMGVGIYRVSGDSAWLWLGCFAVLGVLLSAAWVSWQIWRTNHQSGPLFISVFGSLDPAPDGSALSRLRWLADALSRRDFIFGVIFVAAFGWLPWFLWAAAIGANLYFIVLVLIEIGQRRKAVRHPAE